MNKTDKIYLDLLQDIIDNGKIKGDRTGTGTVSVFGRMIRFNMQEGFPLLTTKKVFTKGIVHELLWFLAGDTNIKYLVDNGVNIWVPDAYKKYVNSLRFGRKMQSSISDVSGPEWNPISQEEFIEKIKNDTEFSKLHGELGPVYGSQWRKWGTNPLGYKGFSGDEPDWVDQIEVMIDTLKNNPDSRRIIVNAWNPTDLPKMTLPPCHYGFEVNTRDLTDGEIIEYYYKYVDKETQWMKDEKERYFYYSEQSDMWFEHSGSDVYFGMKSKCPKKAISLMWHQRSVDTFLGLPFNIASYGILLHMIAAEVNMIPDELIGSLGDVHLYSNHIEKAKEQLSREPRELPKLVITKAKDLFSYKFEDIKFENYDPHPTIKADISV